MSSNVHYCVFVRIENKVDTKLYTPFFATLDEAEVYANHMRVLLPKEGTVVTEPYPVYTTTPEKLEKEFCKVVKNM